MFPAFIACFSVGSVLGLLACRFADRWGCAKKYHSPIPKQVLIALISGIAAAGLYWWEVKHGMLMPLDMPKSTLFQASEQMSLLTIFLQRYTIHLILFTLLLAATLTDFYEMIIPDSITVFGTLLALLAAFLFPLAALPGTNHLLDFSLPGFVFTPAVTPPGEMSPVWTSEENRLASLFLMITLWWFWCFAMLDRVWYARLSFRKANAIFWRYLYRSPMTKLYITAALLIPFFFVVVFASDTDAVSEIALLSALTGMSVGMLLVWAVRLVAQYILGVEAMGFGDVTLMGMIGAFIGWQAVVLVFFLAPFFGLIYGIINVALGKGRAVPYGPFLCLATVVMLLAWRPIWFTTSEYFEMGLGMFGMILLGLLLLFAGLLHIVHNLLAK